HGRPGGVARVVGDDAAAVRGDRLALRAQGQAAAHQVAPPGEELHVHVRERFEARAELGLGPAHPPRHGAYPAVTAREQRDDPVRLTQLLGAQHDAVVAEQTYAAHCLLRSRHLTAAAGTGMRRRLTQPLRGGGLPHGLRFRVPLAAPAVRSQLDVGPLVAHHDSDPAGHRVHDVRADGRPHRTTAASRRAVRTGIRPGPTRGQGAPLARLPRAGPGDGNTIPAFASPPRNSFSTSSVSPTQHVEDLPPPCSPFFSAFTLLTPRVRSRPYTRKSFGRYKWGAAQRG